MFAMHSTRFHLPGGEGNKKEQKKEEKNLGGIDYRQVLSGGDQRPNGVYTLFSPFPPNTLVNNILYFYCAILKRLENVTFRLLTSGCTLHRYYTVFLQVPKQSMQLTGTYT